MMTITTLVLMYLGWILLLAGLIAGFFHILRMDRVKPIRIPVQIDDKIRKNRS